MFEKFTSVKEEQLLKLGQTFALVKRDSSLNIEIMGLYWNTVPKVLVAFPWGICFREIDF